MALLYSPDTGRCQSTIKTIAIKLRIKPRPKHAPTIPTKGREQRDLGIRTSPHGHRPVNRIAPIIRAQKVRQVADTRSGVSKGSAAAPGVEESIFCRNSNEALRAAVIGACGGDFAVKVALDGRVDAGEVAAFVWVVGKKVVGTTGGVVGCFWLWNGEGLSCGGGGCD